MCTHGFGGSPCRCAARCSPAHSSLPDTRRLCTWCAATASELETSPGDALLLPATLANPLKCTHTRCRACGQALPTHARIQTTIGKRPQVQVGAISPGSASQLSAARPQPAPRIMVLSRRMKRVHRSAPFVCYQQFPAF
jgi:hypothetical protein